MEILKDGAATAIYGSRGSNGVILITTKRGKTGKAKFNFDAYTGIQEVYKKFDLLNGTDQKTLIREAIANRNAIRPSNNQINPDADELGEFLALSGNTDWQDEIFRVAPISNYNLSLSGGSDKLKSFISLGIFNQDGNLIGQEFNRYNGRINLDYDATDKLKIGTSITYSNSYNRRVGSDFSGVSVLASAMMRTPNLPVFNDQGVYSLDPLGNNGVENPVMLANDIILENRQKRLIGNLYADYSILPGLTFRTVFGFDNLQEDNNRFEPSYITRRQGNNLGQATMNDDFTWISDNTLNYMKEIGNHRFNVLGGFGLQKNRFRGLTAGGTNTPSDLITNAGVTQPFNPGNPISEWRLLSFFGRGSYSFMDRYVVELSFRRDGSSRFGSNKQYGNFPAVSFAWRVIEEPFMQNFTFLSDLKFRAAYGVTGNQEGVSNFAARALYSGGANYDNRPGIRQSAVPNADLGWEATKTSNIGVDVSVMDGRINLSADAYIKETDDLLFPRDLPWTSGYWNIPLANIGSMENRGLEFMLNTINTTGDFKWNTDFNIAFNRNKITSLPNNAVVIFELPDAFSVEGPYQRYTVGEPVGSFYGYRIDGIFARDTDVPEWLRTGDANTHFYGGYPIVHDADENGLLNREDHVLIGNALPLHTGGITNNFAYKNFELNVFMAWSYGNDIYNVTRAVLESMTDEVNQLATVSNRWRNQGDVTDIPRALYLNSSVRDGFSFTDSNSRFIEDGSFLRVRNATVAYNLPSNLLDRINVSSARVYLSGQNLFTFTNYSGLDPENQNTGGGLRPTLGSDYLTQPQPRIYMVGVNLGF